MGTSNSTDIPKQVLMVGLSKSGKTRFLYETYAFTWNERDLETRGFNYELMDIEGGKIGIWDVGGSEIMKGHWSYFYQNVQIDGIIFMIDASNVEALKNIEESNFAKAIMTIDKKLLTFLIHEEELKDLPFAVFFNFEPPKDGPSTPVKDIILHPTFQDLLKHLGKLKAKGANLTIIKPDENDTTIGPKLKSWLKTEICKIRLAAGDH